MQQFRMFPMKLFQWFLIFFCGNEAESCGGFGGFDLQGPGRVFLGLRANGDDKPVLGMDDGGVFKNERIGAVRQFPSVQKNAGITGVVDDHVAGTRFQPGDGLLNLEAFCQLGEGDFRNTPCALFRRMQPVNIPFRMVGERVQRIKETDFVLARYGGNQFFRFRAVGGGAVVRACIFAYVRIAVAGECLFVERAAVVRPQQAPGKEPCFGIGVFPCLEQRFIAFGEQFGVPPSARVVDAKVADINIRLEVQGLLVFPGAAVPASCLARLVARRFSGIAESSDVKVRAH